MRKLSTWLIVALTAAAFAAGITGGALIAGGPSRGHSTSMITTPPASAPAALPTVARPAASSGVQVRTVSTPVAKSSPPVVRTVVTPPRRSAPSAVQTPEPNPVAVVRATTPPPQPAPAPAAPAAPNPAPAATPSPAPSTAAEPVDVEPAARHAIAAAAVSLLQAATSGEAATTGKGGAPSAADKVVQALEQCLELVATSSLPPGIEPTPCELK